MDRLWRHFGFRKLAFVAVAWPCCVFVRWLTTWNPPSGWYSWPIEARHAVGSLCNLSYGVLFGFWLLLLLSPVWRPASLWRRSIGLSLSALALIWACGSDVLPIMKDLAIWVLAGVPGAAPIGQLLLWIILLPAVCGAVVAYLPDLSEQVQANAMVRRLFVSGRGHAAGWLGPVGTRRLTRSLPLVTPLNGGHRSNRIHLGRSLFESTFAGGQDLWLNENDHLITCARPGSGKFVASIAPNLVMYQGSGIFTSLKPELADFAVGRRTDQSLFADGGRSFPNLGIDTRGITQCRYTLPGGRSFVLDPTAQSVWPSSHHNFLSEIDPRSPSASALINAIAMASFPDNPQQRDPFFIIAPRGLFAATIGHVLTTEKNPQHRNLATCADFCLGIDSHTRIADPDVFQRNIITLMQNSQLGGFIQKSAAAIAQLGPEALGGIFAELELHTRWLADDRIRQQVQAVSDFSYRELGEKDAPVSVFPILPRGGPDLQQLIPWLRTHVELSLAILESKRNRPETQVLALFDEFRQYGQKINAIRRGATTLREAGVKLWVVVQSWPSLVDTLGEDGANELEACSGMEFFGTDQQTAEKIAQALGRSTLRNGRGQQRSAAFGQIVDVVTPAEVMHELRKSSSLKYVFPATLPPVRLRRTAYRSMLTEEGIRYGGLPLAGHYDEHLSQYRYAHRRA